MADSNFAFILNWMNFDGELPFELIQGHLLDKASEAQIKAIKRFLSQNSGAVGPLKYEFNRVQPEPGTSGNHFQHGGEHEWNYWVVNYGKDEQLQDLQHVLNLLPNSLELGFTVQFVEPHGYGFGWRPGALNNFFEDLRKFGEGPQLYTASSFDVVGDRFREVVSLKSTHPDLYMYFNDYQTAKTLPSDSAFLILAYFAILESVLTHRPKDTDTIDSISRQIRSKMVLLGNRYPDYLDYGLFDTAETGKPIWKGLYNVRSTIAHGGQVDYKENKYKPFKDHQTVFEFLRGAIRLVLVAVLREPNFMIDLKDC